MTWPRTAVPGILDTRNPAAGLGPDVTSRTTSRIAWHRHGRPASRLGVLLAVLALSLRLASPMPPTPTFVDAGPLAAFGEHALCLAAATSTAPVSGDTLPTSPGDHADHDHSLCCLWHASAGFALPQIDTAARIVFVETILPVAAAAADFQPEIQSGPNRARGPPQDA